MRKIILLAFLLVTSLALVIFGQTPAGQRDQPIKIGTAEVQLDIVVKDKKGRILKDLKRDDFEIFEDGAKQQVESFRLITRDSPATPKPKSQPPRPNPLPIPANQNPSKLHARSKTV